MNRTTLPLSVCGRCDVLWLASRGRAGGAVHGTHSSHEAFLACFHAGTHRIESLGTVEASRLVSLALLDVIRQCPRPDLTDRAHVGVADLDVPEIHRRAGIPARLLSGYGLSDHGHAVALRACQFMIIGTRDDLMVNRRWRNIRNVLMEAR